MAQQIRKNILKLVTIFSFLLGLSSVAIAQKGKSAKKKGPPKKVMISFDEDLVEGNMTGAELFLIMQKKQTQFGNLFELRENFIPEMYENVEDME